MLSRILLLAVIFDSFGPNPNLQAPGAPAVGQEICYISAAAPMTLDHERRIVMLEEGSGLRANHDHRITALEEALHRQDVENQAIRSDLAAANESIKTLKSSIDQLIQDKADLKACIDALRQENGKLIEKSVNASKENGELIEILKAVVKHEIDHEDKEQATRVVEVGAACVEAFGEVVAHCSGEPDLSKAGRVASQTITTARNLQLTFTGSTVDLSSLLKRLDLLEAGRQE